MGSKKEEALKEVRADVERLHKLATDIEKLDGLTDALLEDLEKDADEVPMATILSIAFSIRGAREECEEFVKYCRER